MALTSFSRSHWPFETKILIEKKLCDLLKVWGEGVGCLISIAYWLFFIFSISDKNVSERVKSVIEHILKLQGYIQNMQNLQVDNQEYAYLKALLLFSPGK